MYYHVDYPPQEPHQVLSPWSESMSQLMRKLDQLNQDIEEALSTGSSPSDTPASTRRHASGHSSPQLVSAPHIQQQQQQQEITVLSALVALYLTTQPDILYSDTKTVEVWPSVKKSWLLVVEWFLVFYLSWHIFNVYLQGCLW